MAEKFYAACAPCRALSRQERLQARWDKAEKLDGWTWEGPIATDDCEGDYDGFWRDLDELQEWLFDNELELSDVRCYATKPMSKKWDATSLAEVALEDAYEGAFDCLPKRSLEELQAFLDVWCEENIPTTWVEDNTKALVFE